MATFGGAQRQMLPGPVGDLETARLASGAANVVAYIPNPAAHNSGTDPYTWAEVVGPDGQTVTAELHAGEGVRATAAIPAETTQRVLAGATRRVDCRPTVRRCPCHRCHRRPSDPERTADVSVDRPPAQPQRHGP